MLAAKEYVDVTEARAQVALSEYEAQYPLLVKLARQEVEQTRKNLDREIAEWRARNALLGETIGRLRRINRALRSMLSPAMIRVAYDKAL